MKGIIGFLVGALLLAVAGMAALMAGRYERNMADAQQSASTEQYDAARASLTAAEAYVPYGRWLPRVGAEADSDIRSRKAALDYWQRNYEAVLPRETDPVGAVEGSNLELQTIVANAAYRAGQEAAHDKATRVQAYDEAIGAFQTVLKNDSWDADAAFNYEFLIRERDAFAKGQPKKTTAPPEATGQFGNSGAPAQSTDTKKFEIYVPLNGSERTKAGEAGKGTGNARKG
jgi:hypothetical protein